MLPAYRVSKEQSLAVHCFAAQRAGLRRVIAPAENSTAAASVKPNSLKSRPRSPGRNEIGTNTAASVSVVAMTAKPIS